MMLWVGVYYHILSGHACPHVEPRPNKTKEVLFPGICGDYMGSHYHLGFKI